MFLLRINIKLHWISLVSSLSFTNYLLLDAGTPKILTNLIEDWVILLLLFLLFKLTNFEVTKEVWMMIILLRCSYELALLKCLYVVVSTIGTQGKFVFEEICVLACRVYLPRHTPHEFFHTSIWLIIAIFRWVAVLIC